MAMTVRKLINELKKMPPAAVVAWRDHDQNQSEINGFARYVEEATDELYEARNRVNGHDENWGLKNKIVVISP